MLATSVAVRHGRTARAVRGRGFHATGCFGGPPPSPSRRLRAVTHSHVARRPSASGVAARQPSSRSARETSSTERRTSPSRGGSKLGSASLPGDRGARAVQLEHARLAAGADVEDAAVVAGRREQRVDDVADEDEVARLAAVAEDRRRLRRAPSARGRSRRRRPRGSTPAAARRRCRTGARRGPCRGCGSSRRGTARRRASRSRTARAAASGASSARGAVALAVDRAAGRGEDDLRAGAPRRLEHLHGADDVHRGVVVGPRDRGHARRPAPRGGRRRRRRRGRARRGCRARRTSPRRSRFSRLPVERSSTTTTSSPRSTSAVDEVRPDEPGATGHDRPHAAVS